jgi:pimeloyl-ACP methyl ester carboxylesterase
VQWRGIRIRLTLPATEGNHEFITVIAEPASTDCGHGSDHAVTAVSSARLYWENKLAFFDVKNITIPVAVSVFPDEIYAAPRSWAEQAFPRLIHYNKLDRGGHFAAWEQPALFVTEMRSTFRSLR